MRSMLFLFVTLPWAFAPSLASAQQDCVTGIHLFKDGACTATVVNTCGKPLNCTITVEGLTASGAKKAESKPLALPSGGTAAHSVAGVARCGDFDLQCNPVSAPRRR